MLYKAFLECISTGNLSNTMKQGIITLIPKPNKDIHFLDNWRPITLLCTDHKILAHVLADRLNKGLNVIIDESQSAFVKGRNIHNHIRMVFDMLDYGEFIDKDSLIFIRRSIEHAFLLNALRFLGFEDNFCGLIKLCYSDTCSSVSLNPGLTSRFKIQRGIRQVCPISPKLFILATQLLALQINNSPELQGINIYD